jgi:lysyl-tRNA synthetase class II
VVDKTESFVELQLIMLRTATSRAALQWRRLARTPIASVQNRFLSSASHGDGNAASTSSSAAEAFERFDGISHFQRYPHAFPVSMTLHEYQRKYENLPSKARMEEDAVNVAGRIMSIRAASKKLVFLDLESDGVLVQVLAELKHFQGHSGTTDATVIQDEFQRVHESLRRGDIIGE